jgi:hypothetical protein
LVPPFSSSELTEKRKAVLAVLGKARIQFQPWTTRELFEEACWNAFIHFWDAGRTKDILDRAMRTSIHSHARKLAKLKPDPTNPLERLRASAQGFLNLAKNIRGLKGRMAVGA